MKEKIRFIIRENIRKLFENDYFPTFDYEDEKDMENKAKDRFLKDFGIENREAYSEPFISPTAEEVSTIKKALYQANLDLPNDRAGVIEAEKMIEKQLANVKTPQEIDRLKNVMTQLWGQNSMNEAKKKASKTPKAVKTPKITKSTSEKKKKEYKIKAPEAPKDIK